MLVKCKICGNKIERDSAYKVVVNNKNQYYCSKKEYLEFKENKEARLKVYNLIPNIIGGTTNTVLFKEINEIASVHSYIKILDYLENNQEDIKKYMDKSFSSEYGKIKYFSTIVKNNIGNYIPITKEVIKNIDTEMVAVRYKAKERKKSLNQYLSEYEVNSQLP